MNTRNPHLKFFLGIAVLWLILAGFVTLQLWPDLPKNNLQWFLLVVVSPLVYVLGEGFFGWLFSQRHGRQISVKHFSVIRALLVLAVVLIVSGFAVLMRHLYSFG